jgi:predicted AlkP superfamily phosphohydrolase/phosphomutase
MPAARYAHAWPRMRAFGFPAYYDGRIRINLQGREARGIVPLSGYSALIDELSAMLRSLQDPRTGAAAVADIQTPVASDPLSAHPTQADLIVSFNDAPLALEHPEIGIVGPVPFRRTGGHTGRFGVLYLSAPDVVPGDYGARSSFDVVPTIARLLGNHPPDAFSGEPIPVPGVTTGETELSGCA